MGGCGVGVCGVWGGVGGWVGVGRLGVYMSLIGESWTEEHRSMPRLGGTLSATRTSPSLPTPYLGLASTRACLR